MGFLTGGKQQKRKKEPKRGVRKSKSARLVDSDGKPAPRRRGRLPAAFKRPEQPGVDTTSFPGEGNPNSWSGHGEAEAEAEDSEGEEFWECWECPVCHFRWGAIVAECYTCVKHAKELAKDMKKRDYFFSPDFYKWFWENNYATKDIGTVLASIDAQAAVLRTTNYSFLDNPAYRNGYCHLLARVEATAAALRKTLARNTARNAWSRNEFASFLATAEAPLRKTSLATVAEREAQSRQRQATTTLKKGDKESTRGGGGG